MKSRCAKVRSKAYKPRRPEKTVLHKVVKQQYRTWCNQVEEPIPYYIAKEFSQYLRCGVLAHGFAYARCDGCNEKFLLAFSCKGRGICPSCNSRDMAEVAKHLVEAVIPSLPMRQWVISFPKRLRIYLETSSILTRVLNIVACEIRNCLMRVTAGESVKEFGAISFVQRFGNTLNFHPHFHLIVADGTLSRNQGSLEFKQAILTYDDLLDTQEAIQQKVLRWFQKKGILQKEEVERMLRSDNSGFSLDCSVHTEAEDRAGLERVIRYCARPPFVSENLSWRGGCVHYRLPKPTHTGIRSLQLSPIEFIEKIAALIPPPRKHRRHYHGFFSSNHPFRKSLAEKARQERGGLSPLSRTVIKARQASKRWADLIWHIYEEDPLLCECGEKMKIRGFVTNPHDIHRILSLIGWPKEPMSFDPVERYVEPFLRESEADYSQLLPNTADGFPEEIDRVADPPVFYDEGGGYNTIDPPHPEEYGDPPHCEEENSIIYD